MKNTLDGYRTENNQQPAYSIPPPNTPNLDNHTKFEIKCTIPSVSPY